MSQEKMLTFCQHCHMKCRLFVTVKEGKIQSIKNAMAIPHHGGTSGTFVRTSPFPNPKLLFPNKDSRRHMEPIAQCFDLFNIQFSFSV